MQQPSPHVARASRSRFACSRVTNGRLPAGIDGARRRAAGAIWCAATSKNLRATSALDRGLIHVAATLALKLEEMQEAQLRGQGSAVDAGELTRLAGQ